MDNREALLGKTPEELRQVVEELDLPGFTASQISNWLYQKKVADIEEMTNLSKKARAMLQDKYVVGRTTPSRVQTSVDGTKKYLFPAHTNLFIESAYIPEENRETLCVSSQVGCKMGCLFCMISNQAIHAQLSGGEINKQVMIIEER